MREERMSGPTQGNPWLGYIDEKIVWGPLYKKMPPPPARVLDLGCGDGRIAIRLSNRGFRAVGVDLHPGAGPRLLARAESLPFRPASFDVVLLVLVLMHVRSADQLMTEVRRVLRTGGRLLVAVGNRHSFTGLAIRENDPDFLLKRIPYDCYRSFSRKELEHLLRTSGFKTETLRSATFVPSFFSKGSPSLLRGILTLARILEQVLERIPLVRSLGIRLFAVAKAVET